MALNARRAAVSAILARLSSSEEPKSVEAEMSTAMMTVSSRSSTYFLMCATPVRAVTFQSMSRTSSPSVYVRTSLNSIPRPR